MGELYDISDVMEGVQQSLHRTEMGKRTQARQEDVIARLQAMIDRLRERQAGGSAGGAGAKPAAQSVPPEGSAPDRVGLPVSPSPVEQRWIGLKPAERAAIESEVHQKLPARYRKMIEQYYERLGKSPR